MLPNVTTQPQVVIGLGLKFILMFQYAPGLSLAQTISNHQNLKLFLAHDFEDN